MKQRCVRIWTIFFLLLISACSKDDGVTTPQEPVKSTLKQINTFIFKADVNNALSMDINANINETNKTITATVPYGTDISALRPEISVSEKASVSIDSFTDFTEIVKITVTAEDGSAAVYDVVISIEPNNANNILSLTFSLTENPIAITIVGEINEENQTITFETPLGTDISSFLPQIQTSEGSTFAPEGRQDFNVPVVYTITAENGAEKSYEVIWEISQRNILITLYNENPENTLDWDLENPDISSWDGVTTDEEGNIIVLDLESKSIQDLPKVIGRLNELTALSVFNNALTVLPSEIGQLTQLQMLELSANQLSSLPSEIGSLVNLTRLFVGSNQLTELPVEIGLLTNLTRLSFNSNRLRWLPEEFSQLNIKNLDLTRNFFVVAPPSIFNLPNIEVLKLDYNPLKSLPTTIGEAKKLKSLFIRNSGLKKLPDEIGGLESLTNLNISNAKLTTIPSTIGQLTNLESLGLGNNLITELPEEIGQLTELESLSLGNNLITELPEEIGQLGQLKNLFLDINRLTVIPEELGLLDNLEILSLTSNPDLLILPQAICDLQDTGTQLVLDSTTVCQ